MSGNVWDWYSSDTSTAVRDPVGAASGSYRVGRGGSRSSGGESTERAYRYYYSLCDSYNFLGLRLACRP